MTLDKINGLFELIGSMTTWMSVRRVYVDKGYSGIWLPAVLFFLSWGFFNMLYYPSLRQWWSFFGGCSMVAANIAWVFFMAHYGRKQ